MSINRSSRALRLFLQFLVQDNICFKMGWFGRVCSSCFATKPLPICCAAHVKESTSTRFLYCCILTVVSVLSVIFHTGGLAHSTATQVLGDMMLEFCSHFQTREHCVRFVGYLAVYRFCIPLSIFHFILMLCTIQNSNSQSWSGKIHNGFWFWKCAFIIGLWVMSIFFPSLDKATTAWMLMAVLGGIAFIYLQNVFFIDYAYEFNGIWFRRSKQKPVFRILIFTLTATLYLGTFVAYFVLWALWGYLNSCVLNAMIVYVNVCLTALLLLLSFAQPRIRSQSLYLPGAVTAAFAAYLTWSAVMSQPKSVVRGVPVEKQAIQFFNLRLHSNRSASHKLAMNRTGLLMDNVCLPAILHGPSALDHISDLFAALGIILVVGGSIYSSMRATLQAKRLGIKTRRQKMKTIIQKMLAELKEEENQQREAMGRSANPASTSPTLPPPSSQSCACFGTERRKKRRRMVLEMLKEIVDSTSPSEHESISSETVPPVKNPNESLRRRLLKKRLGLASPSSAPQLIPSPPAEVEMLAMGEISPAPTSKTLPRVSVNVECLVGVSTLPHRSSASSSNGRCAISNLGKERPSSTYGTVNFPLAQDLKDFISINDVRLEKARFVTQYLAGDEGRHLLHENKEMAESVVSLAEVLLPQRSPKDRFTIYNEAILTVYSYAWFHFTFCLATLFMMAQLTNWYNPELSSLQAVMESWANMWMKLFSAFLALLLYLWTLCFMRFCFSRSLIQTPLNPATHWVAKEPENNPSQNGNKKYLPSRV
ncbi:serine incorporator 5 [Echinococcus multilocularis]|uniref:Serine incorporator 5 n=1 Tax=Echinococcus multilocularis TaxID=6211 RepID=A0A068XW87_ECHMU|nr:serine incorporator 5 [Echinococcus multilocularis]